VKAMAEPPAKNPKDGGVFSFPYKKAYMSPPTTYFTNLRKYSYVTVSEAPYVQSMRCASRGRRAPGKRPPGSVRPGIANTPWGFNGKEISLVVSEEAYEKVDIITDYFTEPARMRARIKGSRPPLDAWKDEQTLVRVVSKASDGGRKALTIRALREAVYSLAPECSLFKVSLAAEIYRFFISDPPRSTVFDPFAGWGDRAIAAAGAGIGKYVGTDPNPNLTSGYKSIVEFLKKEAPGSTITVRLLPIEEFGPVQFSEDMKDGADLVFSSPPFYGYEIYCDDGKQSARFRGLNQWLHKWFFPATDRAWSFLKPGGHLAYYLTDSRGEVTTPLRKHMAALKREFMGVIACRRGKKRPLPLWVWKKGGTEKISPLPITPAARSPRGNGHCGPARTSRC
jgi:hypothetical protein